MWTHVATRVDSPIRYWLITQCCILGRNKDCEDSPETSLLQLEKCYYDQNGNFHWDAVPFAAYMDAMIARFRCDPHWFLSLREKYAPRCEKLLQAAMTVSEEAHERLSDERLADLFSTYLDAFIRFAPTIMFTFAVEHLYERQYPDLFRRIWHALADGETLSQFAEGLAPDERGLLLNTAAQHDGQWSQAMLRDILETPQGLTEGEQKTRALADLARVLRPVLGKRAFGHCNDPELDAPDKIIRMARYVLDHCTDVLPEVQAVRERYGWIKHWGLPPFKSASTDEDIACEALRLLSEGAVDRIISQHADRPWWVSIRQSLLDFVGISNEERCLLDTISTYKQFRTWRMERFICSEVMLVPYFREVERRALARGLLSRPDDVFFLTVPEVIDLLSPTPATVNPPVDMRRQGFGVLYQNGGFRVLAGKELSGFDAAFRSILWDREGRRADVTATRDCIGGKGEMLSLLAKRAVAKPYHVPRFFVVTTKAYAMLLGAAKSCEGREALPRVPQSASVCLEDMCGQANSTVAKSVRHAIMDAATELGCPHFAVRSSSTLEDSSGSSFAGVHRSEVAEPATASGLLAAVARVHSSLRSPAASTLAAHFGVDLEGARMAVIVQERVEADLSGVVDCDFREIGLHRCEIVRGLGDRLMAGTASPDLTFLFRVDDGKARVVRSSGVPESNLPPEMLSRLSEAVTDLRELLGPGQNIEWCWANGRVALLQSRPRATHAQPPCDVSSAGAVGSAGRVLAEGLAGGPCKTVVGRAVIMERPQPERISEGDILVCHTVTPEWDPVILRATALVVDEGGITSHAIRIADELGIPAVVNAHTATKAIHNGQDIIVDTSDLMHGKVRAADRVTAVHSHRSKKDGEAR